MREFTKEEELSKEQIKTLKSTLPINLERLNKDKNHIYNYIMYIPMPIYLTYSHIYHNSLVFDMLFQGDDTI